MNSRASLDALKPGAVAQECMLRKIGSGREYGFDRTQKSNAQQVACATHRHTAYGKEVLLELHEDCRLAISEKVSSYYLNDTLMRGRPEFASYVATIFLPLQRDFGNIPMVAGIEPRETAMIGHVMPDHAVDIEMIDRSGAPSSHGLPSEC